MESILIGVAVLACPVGMGLMMWFMAKGMRGDSKPAKGENVDDLRSEHQRLGAEIERLEEGNGRATPLSRSR
jgi:hypothetical protein